MNWSRFTIFVVAFALFWLALNYLPMFEVVYSEDGKNMTQSCSLNYRLSCYNDQMDDAHYPPFLKTNWWLVAVTALIPAILAAATVGLFPNKPKDQDPLKLYTQ